MTTTQPTTTRPAKHDTRRRYCDCENCSAPSWMTPQEVAAWKWDNTMADTESKTFAAMGN
jgi:hypothetical protein